MIELRIVDKQKYLDENHPYIEKPKLTDMMECIHCGGIKPSAISRFSKALMILSTSAVRMLLIVMGRSSIGCRCPIRASAAVRGLFRRYLKALRATGQKSITRQTEGELKMKHCLKCI
jgi:hypothetical protein